jgi:SAM-dependent methyltransferase
MKFIKKIKHLISINTANKFLLRIGFSIKPVGESYAYSPRAVKRLDSRNIDVNTLIEEAARYQSKYGQRDRICERVTSNLSLKNIKNVLEVGPGTGRFTNKILELLNPSKYYVIETSKPWRKYLMKKFGSNPTTQFFAPIPTGHDFSSIESNSIDLLHGHGVFVYLNHVTMYSYLLESIRVIAPGGYLYLEYFSIEKCTSEILDNWHKSIHWFPIFQSDEIVDRLLLKSGFVIMDEWNEMFGESHTRNVLFQKQA